MTNFHSSAVRGFCWQSIVDSKGEGGVIFTSLGRKMTWRPPWTYDLLFCLFCLFCLLSTKDVSVSRLLNRKTSIASTRKKLALNRSMVNYGNFFTWYSCFVPQLSIPTNLEFFWKKRKAKYSTRVVNLNLRSQFFSLSSLNVIDLWVWVKEIFLSITFAFSR